MTMCQICNTREGKPYSYWQGAMKLRSEQQAELLSSEGESPPVFKDVPYYFDMDKQVGYVCNQCIKDKATTYDRPYRKWLAISILCLIFLPFIHFIFVFFDLIILAFALFQLQLAMTAPISAVAQELLVELVSPTLEPPIVAITQQTYNNAFTKSRVIFKKEETLYPS